MSRVIRFAITLATAFAVLPLAAALHAQSPPASVTEVQVPFDERGGVLVVDRALAARIGLFLDRHPRFREARLYRTAEGGHVLEVLSSPDEPGASRDARVRERIPLTPEELDDLRARFSAGLRAHAPERLHDQEGRPLLVSGLTLLGLGWYGWSVPLAAEFDDGETAVGTYMLISSASFFVPFMATQHATVTEADADLALHGASRGIVHGFFLRDLTGGDNSNDETTPALSTAVSVAECAAYFLWSRSANLDAGTTGTMGILSDYGTWSAYGLTYAFEDESNRSPETRAGAALFGAGAGLVAGQAFGRGRDLSRGDAGVMRTTTIVGAFVGVAAGDLLGDEFDDDPFILGGVAGGAAGFLVGNAMVRNHQFTQGQSRLIFLGAAAGSLFGLGAALTAGSNADEVALQTTAIGSALGLLAIYSMLEDRSQEVSFAPAARPRDRRLGLAVHPEALLAAQRTEAGARETALVTATWHFGEPR